MAGPTNYDLVVVGSGIAGLSAALSAAEQGRRTLLLTKDALEEANTRYAQGGIAAALGEDDSAGAHLQDTVAAGAGLVDERAAAIMTAAARAQIERLVALGVPFDRDDHGGGQIALGREAAHSAFRIVHAGGDATGAHIEHTLADRVRASGVAVREHAVVTDLLVKGGRMAGVDVLGGRDGRRERIAADAVILATGGAGRLYRYTTNPPLATGDGVALAYRAGAEVMDLEFIQFHPTALRLPNAPVFLVSEAVRGEGAILRDAQGVAFMRAYDPREELAPRDVVARAIHEQMARTGAECVYLDLRHLPAERVRGRFPHIDAFCREHGLDMTRDLLPVAPAAHYTMGGVRTDDAGTTNVGGLFACGEVACTGVHGANRLASNSLLEALVFAGRAVAGALEGRPPAPAQPAARSLPPAEPGETSPPAVEALQRLLWDEAGIVRAGEGLEHARRALAAWAAALPPAEDRAACELQNLVLVGRLLVEAALLRRESRGAHFRADYPKPSPDGLRHFVFRRDADVAHTN